MPGGVPGGQMGGVIGGVVNGQLRVLAVAMPMRVAKMQALSTLTEDKSDGSGSAAAHVRSYFPEALYINPEIITDADGRASIVIPVADSITTWRMAMLASTTHGALGTATSSLKALTLIDPCDRGVGGTMRICIGWVTTRACSHTYTCAATATAMELDSHGSSRGQHALCDVVDVRVSASYLGERLALGEGSDRLGKGWLGRSLLRRCTQGGVP